MGKEEGQNKGKEIRNRGKRERRDKRMEGRKKVGMEEGGKKCQAQNFSENLDTGALKD